MSRYIEYEPLMAELEREVEMADDWKTAHEISNVVKYAPSIDIVRCKECIHCADDWNGDQPMFTCELGRCGESVQPNDFCSYGERRKMMSGIKFYIPKDETIPTDLRLYVGDTFVTYKSIDGGFLFYIDFDDETEAMKVAEEIVRQMKLDHDEPHHGVSWRTVSLEVVPQDERYKVGTIIRWKYRVRDSY